VISVFGTLRGPRGLTLASLACLALLFAACDTGEPPPTGADTTPDLGCLDADELRIYVPPKATYLRVSESDHNSGARASTPTRLADLGIQPGDQLRLERFGEFQYNRQHPDLVYYGMLVLFSSTSELLGPTERHRVPGALSAGIETHISRPTRAGNLPTNIPEDFVLGMERNGDPTVPYDEPIMVQVPEGARFLFLSPEDDLFHDNIDQDEDFALCITIVNS
jgi:hypothetical protein